MTEPLIPLKPCPFCGSKEVELYTRHAMTRTAGIRWYVQCDDCGARGSSDLGNSGACEAWNTRPLDAQLLEAAKEMARCLNDQRTTSTNEFIDAVTGLEAAIAAAEGSDK